MDNNVSSNHVIKKQNQLKESQKSILIKDCYIAY